MMIGMISLLCASASQAQQKDYSKGFKKFYELGLPDVTNATYVKLEMYDSDISRLNMPDELNLSENAWLIQEDKKTGKALFVVNNCRMVEIYDNKILQKERETRLKEERAKKKDGKHPVAVTPDDSGDGRIAGKWKTVDEKKDIDRIIVHLKKGKETTGGPDVFSYTGAAGSLFLCAIHFHRQGYTNEANELAGILFEGSQDQRKVITEGLNQLADDQYADACARFFKDGDWQAYSGKLDTLVARFPMGWEMSPAVKRVAERVRARLAHPQPPAITGEGITDEDRKLALDLATATNTASLIRHMPNEFWILSSAASRLPVPTGETNVIARIMKRGVRSVPLLMALLKDDYLTRLDYKRMRLRFGGDFFHFSSGGSDELSEEDIGKMYNSSQRPAALSDLAMLLLSRLIPNKEENRESPTRDEICEQCKQWYAAHKDQSEIELARFYLKEGDQMQQYEARIYLIMTGTEGDMALIEDDFLGQEDLLRYSSQAQQYVEQQYVERRGDKAKQFVDKLEANFKKSMASGDKEMFKDENHKKAIERRIASLKEMVSTKSFDQVLADIPDGKRQFQEETGQALRRSLAGKTPEEALTIVLDAALRAKTAELCLNLVQFANQAPDAITHWRTYSVEPEEEEEAPKEQKPAMDIKKHADQWKKLLADNRTVTQEESNGEAESISDAVAHAIEMIYSNSEAYDSGENDAVGLLGDRVSALTKSRAETRLAGKSEKDLPHYPSADNVTPEQRKKLVDQIMKATGSSLESQIAGLNFDNLLALTEESGDNEKLNAKLVPLAHRVVKITGNVEKPETLKQNEGLKGKVLDKAMTEQLLALCRRMTKDGSIARCTLTRQDCLGGIEIWISEVSPTNKEFRTKSDRLGYGRGGNKTPHVSGGIDSGGDLHVYATWYLDEETAAAKKIEEAAKGPADDALPADAVNVFNERDIGRAYQTQDEFWKTFERLRSGEDNVCHAAGISILGTPILPEQKDEQSGAKEETIRTEVIIKDGQTITTKTITTIVK
jgi:hypothetical protein